MTTAVTTIQIVHGTEATATIVEALAKPEADASGGIMALARFLEALAGGVYQGKVTLRIEDTNSQRAYATITCDQAAALDGDTVVIGVKTLTAKTSPAGENQFAIGASSAAMATALAACINANSVLKGVVVATATGASVLVQETLFGIQGIHILLSETGAGMALSDTSLSGASSTQSAAVRTWVRGVAA